jgi:hypothetical protein
MFASVYLGSELVLILARIVTAWFKQWDGNPAINRSKNIVRGWVPSIVTRTHCSHYARERESLFWTTLMS